MIHINHDIAKPMNGHQKEVFLEHWMCPFCGYGYEDGVMDIVSDWRQDQGADFEPLDYWCSCTCGARWVMRYKIEEIYI